MKSQNSSLRRPTLLTVGARLLFIILVIPVVPFLVGIALEALLWSSVFKKMAGITFAGSFWEGVLLAISISLCGLSMNLCWILARRLWSRFKKPLTEGNGGADEDEKPQLDASAAAVRMRIEQLKVYRDQCLEKMRFSFPRAFLTSVAFLIPILVLIASLYPTALNFDGFLPLLEVAVILAVLGCLQTAFRIDALRMSLDQCFRDMDDLQEEREKGQSEKAG